MPVDRAMIEKQNTERVALRQKLADMAKDAGLTLDEVFGKGRKRMLLWMVAATKGNKANKDDFLI